MIEVVLNVGNLGITTRLLDLVIKDFGSWESLMSVIYSATVKIYDLGQVLGCGK